MTVKLITYSTLYPNAAQPQHGVFVENRLRHLIAAGKAEARVIAPVPWFPSTASVFKSYATFARAPRQELRHGVRIEHPRYVVIPKVGQALTPYLLYRASIGAFEQHLASGYDFQLIDAHFFYPDGVAAALLGQRFGRPVVITARGSDLSLMLEYPLPRRMIRWAAERAAGLVTVCQALKDSLLGIGVPEERVVVLRNGVDLRLFAPQDREQARAALGLTRPTLLSVGLLVARKGHDLTIRAMAALPGYELLLVGEGPERHALAALAETMGVADRVRFMGRVPHEALARVYSAADALVLASSREGWANVLLEAMACGTPVVASDVWGTPEVVAEPAAGVLMRARTPDALAQAVQTLFASLPDRAATRRYAEGFSWEATTAGQAALFEQILQERPRAAA